MNDHEGRHADITAYAASRLGEKDLRDFEAHLRECAECREMAETWKGIAAALRDGGEELFSPHPEEMELRGFARGEESAADDRIRSHIDLCTTCALEVEAWKRVQDGARVVPGEASARAARLRFGVLSAAAGLILGLGLGFLLFPLRTTDTIPSGTGVDLPGRSEQWSGAARHLLLPRVLRSETGIVTYEIGDDEPYVVVDFQVPRPEAAADADRYRFEIARSDGAIAWSSELTASEIRDHLEAMDLITFVVPTAVLSPARYEFRVVGPGMTEETPWYRVSAEIVAPE